MKITHTDRSAAKRIDKVDRQSSKNAAGTSAPSREQRKDAALMQSIQHAVTATDGRVSASTDKTPPVPAEIRIALSADETAAADSERELPTTGTNDDEANFTARSAAPSAERVMTV